MCALMVKLWKLENFAIHGRNMHQKANDQTLRVSLPVEVFPCSALIYLGSTTNIPRRWRNSHSTANISNNLAKLRQHISLHTASWAAQWASYWSGSVNIGSFKSYWTPPHLSYRQQTTCLMWNVGALDVISWKEDEWILGLALVMLNGAEALMTGMELNQSLGGCKWTFTWRVFLTITVRGSTLGWTNTSKVWVGA